MDLVIRRCPSCGGDRIKKLRRDWSHPSGKPATVVRDLEFYECPDCHERLYDREAMRRIEAAGRPKPHRPAHS